ncbi:MAG: DUF6152 family protein [Steroidobacteraceae bacterium]
MLPIRPFITAAAMMVVAVVSSPDALAHHSFAAMYDATKPIRIEGKLSQVNWTNPHASFLVEVHGRNGETVTWICEGAGPGALSRRGFNKSDVKVGDTLIVDGYLARSGKRVMDAQRITLPGGRVFSTGSAGAAGPGGNAASLPDAAPAQ